MSILKAGQGEGTSRLSRSACICCKHIVSPRYMCGTLSCGACVNHFEAGRVTFGDLLASGSHWNSTAFRSLSWSVAATTSGSSTFCRPLVWAWGGGSSWSSAAGGRLVRGGCDSNPDSAARRRPLLRAWGAGACALFQDPAIGRPFLRASRCPLVRAGGAQRKSSWKPLWRAWCCEVTI